MTDAKGESSREVRYTLEPNGEGEYILTVTADTEWINAPERAFPVTIDPPVHIQGFYNIETGTIMEYAPDSYSGQVATESLGYYSLNNGSCRMLVRVNNLPDIPDKVSIHKAQGLEYNSVKVVIPSSNSEQITHGVFYTAITRSKQYLKIYWSSETMQEIVKSFYAGESNQQSLEIVKSKLE